MESIAVTEAAAWNQELLALPNPHVLQSWEWGEFKSLYGWSATRLSFREEGRTVAAASVLERKLPRLPARILYVPKGPALDWSDSGCVESALHELESLARRRRAVFVKIDPDVYYDGVTPGLSLRPACAAELARTMATRGWHFSREQIQFRHTVLLDLTRSEDELLEAMKQKSRYNVRLAGRHGVVVRMGTAADLPAFYRLYAETARRDRFLIRPPAYYDEAWGSFLRNEVPPPAAGACLLLAELEGVAMAGLMLFTFGTTAWYMYGASSDRHRQHMPNHLLQWEAMRWARAEGKTLYDLWGAPDRLEPSDAMWGVYQFKLGLGGELARGLGAWDFAPNRAAYGLYTVVMPRVLGLMRRGQMG